MTWIKLGTRIGSIYQKSKKVLAWSKGLKDEIGFGFTQFIATKDGSQYILSEDEEKIKTLIKQNFLDLKYLDKTEELNEEIRTGLEGEKLDYKKILDLSVSQLAYFYIANEVADLIYESLGSSDKKRVERFRNNQNLFTSDDELSLKLAGYLSIPQENLETMTMGEIKQALDGKMPDELDIKNRLDSSWSLSLQDGQISLSLEDLSPIKTSTGGDVKVIKGQVAFKVDEKIVGIIGQDILVAWMTHPDMVLEMKKMKAIITDEGGVLSHAAITAREFKIPTIIGTKVATKVLKNGDKVEVDANNGIVRKLK